MSGQVKASGVRCHHLFSSASLHHHEQPPRVWASNRCGGAHRCDSCDLWRERECVERCTHTQAELSGGREREREREKQEEKI